eukprot:TRINITY_DN768_c0_g2_i13.p1 TRINITY_DN768_c0_g2~~TRINITY_DN768_c0_g2_i13.p1  ORF type:complete len:121 (+),score=11.34 TRINITY_DN768_c0_g2_i13:1331-1693(+)
MAACACFEHATPDDAQHIVRIGKRPGAHLCTCLQLAHTGLPCRHYLAVVFNVKDIEFDLNVHLRWLTREVQRGETAVVQQPLAAPGAGPCAAEAATLAKATRQVLKSQAEAMWGVLWAQI